MEALGRALRSFHEKHDKIKHTVHTVRMQLIEDIAIFFVMYLLLTQLYMLKYLATSIHTIKKAWRYPLPRWGQYAMGCFYFTIPVVGGWYVMQWAISKSVDEIGARGEKLQNKQLEGFGNKTLIDGKEERIGAGGGKFGGVHLAMSDESTQDNNRKMLEAMFRKERRKRRKDQQLEVENDEQT